MEQLILTSSSALECKVLSKDIVNFDASMWKENAQASCTPGILAKFEQHPMLSKLLLSTGSKVLVECCKDKDWGTGIPLFDQNALKENQWYSQGLLGEILETVRTILTQSKNTSTAENACAETAVMS